MMRQRCNGPYFPPRKIFKNIDIVEARNSGYYMFLTIFVVDGDVEEDLFEGREKGW